MHNSRECMNKHNIAHHRFTSICSDVYVRTLFNTISAEFRPCALCNVYMCIVHHVHWSGVCMCLCIHFILSLSSSLETACGYLAFSFGILLSVCKNIAHWHWNGLKMNFSSRMHRITALVNSQHIYIHVMYINAKRKRWRT